MAAILSRGRGVNDVICHQLKGISSAVSQFCECKQHSPFYAMFCVTNLKMYPYHRIHNTKYDADLPLWSHHPRIDNITKNCCKKTLPLRANRINILHSGKKMNIKFHKTALIPWMLFDIMVALVYKNSWDQIRGKLLSVNNDESASWRTWDSVGIKMLCISIHLKIMHDESEWGWFTHILYERQVHPSTDCKWFKVQGSRCLLANTMQDTGLTKTQYGIKQNTHTKKA